METNHINTPEWHKTLHLTNLFSSKPFHLTLQGDRENRIKTGEVKDTYRGSSAQRTLNRNYFSKEYRDIKEINRTISFAEDYKNNLKDSAGKEAKKSQRKNKKSVEFNCFTLATIKTDPHPELSILQSSPCTPRFSKIRHSNSNSPSKSLSLSLHANSKSVAKPKISPHLFIHKFPFSTKTKKEINFSYLQILDIIEKNRKQEAFKENNQEISKGRMKIRGKRTRSWLRGSIEGIEPWETLTDQFTE